MCYRQLHVQQWKTHKYKIKLNNKNAKDKSQITEFPPEKEGLESGFKQAQWFTGTNHYTLFNPYRPI